MKHLGILLVAVAFALSARAGGDSSDGHTHAAPAPAPTVGVAVAPRAAAATEDFELVAVLDGTNLTLYLDRFASNAPVTKALIEIESGAAFKGTASEIGPGIYALPAAALARPGKHPLTITVQAGDSADLLNAMLTVGEPGTSPPHRHSRDEWLAWSGAAFVVLLAGGLVAVRRHRKLRKK